MKLIKGYTLEPSKRLKVKVASFRWAWIPLGHVKVDDYRKTCVHRTMMPYHADPFILASDAT